MNNKKQKGKQKIKKRKKNEIYNKKKENNK